MGVGLLVLNVLKLNILQACRLGVRSGATVVGRDASLVLELSAGLRAAAESKIYRIACVISIRYSFTPSRA